MNIVYWLGRVIAVLLIVIIVMTCVGCVTAEPYAEFGISYQVDGNTDQLVRTDHPDQCSLNGKFDAEIGYEMDSWKIGYRHQSWLRCGGPFNNRPEIYADDIRLSKKFGGK